MNFEAINFGVLDRKKVFTLTEMEEILAKDLAHLEAGNDPQSIFIGGANRPDGPGNMNKSGTNRYYTLWVIFTDKDGNTRHAPWGFRTEKSDGEVVFSSIKSFEDMQKRIANLEKYQPQLTVNAKEDPDCLNTRVVQAVKHTDDIFVHWAEKFRASKARMAMTKGGKLDGERAIVKPGDKINRAVSLEFSEDGNARDDAGNSLRGEAKRIDQQMVNIKIPFDSTGRILKMTFGKPAGPVFFDLNKFNPAKGKKIPFDPCVLVTENGSEEELTLDNIAEWGTPGTAGTIQVTREPMGHGFGFSAAVRLVGALVTRADASINDTGDMFSEFQPAAEPEETAAELGEKLTVTDGTDSSGVPVQYSAEE